MPSQERPTPDLTPELTEGLLPEPSGEFSSLEQELELPDDTGEVPEAGLIDSFQLPNGMTVDSAESAFPPPELPPDSVDIPGLLPNGATDDDPFANIDIEPQPETFDGGPGSLHGPSLSSNGVFLSEEPTKAPLAKIALNRGSSQMATVAAPSYQPTIEQPKAPAWTPPKRVGAWPTLLGIALGCAAAFFLLTEQGQAISGPASAQLAARLLTASANAPEGVRIERAQVRSYPGAKGPMLVIFGEVKNLGAQPLIQAQAVVQVLQDDQVILRKEAPLGQSFTEAQLRTITGPETLSQLSAEAPSRTLEPGASLPFMIIFSKPPEGLQSKRFRLRVLQAPQGPEKSG